MPDYYDYMTPYSTGFKPSYGREEEPGLIDLDSYQPDEPGLLDLDSYKPEPGLLDLDKYMPEETWGSRGSESFLPERHTVGEFQNTLRGLGIENEDIISGASYLPRFGDWAYNSLARPLASPFGIAATGVALSGPIGATAVGLGGAALGGYNLIQDVPEFAKNPTFEGALDIGANTAMIYGGGKLVKPGPARPGPRVGPGENAWGIGTGNDIYGFKYRTPQRAPYRAEPINLWPEGELLDAQGNVIKRGTEALVPTGPVEPARGSVRPLETQPKVVTIYDRASIPYYEAQGYVEVPGLKDHNGHSQMMLASDADVFRQPPSDLPFEGDFIPPSGMEDSPGRMMADDTMRTLQNKDEAFQAFVRSMDMPPVFGADITGDLFDQARGISIADAIDPNQPLTRPGTFNREFEPSTYGEDLLKERPIEPLISPDMVSSGDWSKRPHPRAVRGDEAIPELAFQPDEGKVTEYDTNESFIPEEGKVVYGGTTREEANRLREETPEGWVNSATLRFPESRDEALSIYYEREPERISQNLAHYAAAEQAAWKPFFKESNNRAHNRPTMSNEEYNQLSFAHSRAKALMEIAQSIYERTSGRMIEGRSDTRKKMGGGGYFTGNEPDFFQQQPDEINLSLGGRDPLKEMMPRRSFGHEVAGEMATGGGLPPDDSGKMREDEIRRETDLNVLRQEYNDFKEALDRTMRMGDSETAAKMAYMVNLIAKRMEELRPPSIREQLGVSPDEPSTPIRDQIAEREENERLKKEADDAIKRLDEMLKGLRRPSSTQAPNEIANQRPTIFNNPEAQKMYDKVRRLDEANAPDEAYKWELPHHLRGLLKWQIRHNKNPNIQIPYRLPDGTKVMIPESEAQGRAIVRWPAYVGPTSFREVDARRMVKNQDTYRSRLLKSIRTREEWYNRDLMEAEGLNVEIRPGMSLGEISTALYNEKRVRDNIAMRQRMVRRGEQMPLGILEKNNEFSEGFGGERKPASRNEELELGEVSQLRDEHIEAIAYAMDILKRSKDSKHRAETERSLADILKFHEDLGQPIQPSEIARKWAEIIDRDRPIIERDYKDIGETDRELGGIEDEETTQLMREGADRMALGEQGQGNLSFTGPERMGIPGPQQPSEIDISMGGDLLKEKPIDLGIGPDYATGGDDWMNQMNNRLNQPIPPDKTPQPVQQELETPPFVGEKTYKPETPPLSEKTKQALTRQHAVNSTIDIEDVARKLETDGELENARAARAMAKEMRSEFMRNHNDVMRQAERFESLARLKEREGDHAAASRLKAQAQTEYEREAGQLELMFRKSRLAERARQKGLMLKPETIAKIDKLNPDKVGYGLDHDFADLVLNSVKDGPPGLTIRDVSPNPGRRLAEFEITIRNNDGSPLIHAEIMQDRLTKQGDLKVLALRNGVGLGGGEPILQMAKALEDHNALVPKGRYSVHTRNFLEKLKRLYEEFKRDETGAMPMPKWTQAMPRIISDSWEKLKQKTGWSQGPSQIAQQNAQYTFLDELFAIPKNLTTTMDLSAPFRQGLGFINTPQFWRAAYNMFPGGLSQRSFDRIDAQIRDLPIFRPGPPDPVTGLPTPSIAEKNGYQLFVQATRPGPRVQSVASKWLETGEFFNKKLPVGTPIWYYTAGIPIRMSNRAYITFSNHLGANRAQYLFDKAYRGSLGGIQTAARNEAGPGLGYAKTGFLQKQVVDMQQAFDMNPYYNNQAAREILDSVQTINGHSPLKGYWAPHKYATFNLEPAARNLAKFYFSPGLMASRFKMLNPGTYTQATPFVRRQYMHGALGLAAGWIGGLTMLKMAADAMGVENEITLDPTSADFGKLRIGKFRVDPGASVQQWLVFFSRLIAGGYTPAQRGPEDQPRFHELGSGFQATTAGDIMLRFNANKLEPMTKLAYDMAFASGYQPVNMYDRMLQLVAPMYGGDLWEIQKHDPDLLPFALPMMFGMGTQIYGAGESEGKFIPKENDWIYQGGGLRGLIMGTDYPTGRKPSGTVGPQKMDRRPVGPTKGVGPQRIP